MNPLAHREKVDLVDRDNECITICRQSKLLDISRASLYYQKTPVSQENVDLMNSIDEIYTKYPFYGSRRIRKELSRKYKLTVNRKHIQRLMKEMGIETIYPKKNTSRPNLQNFTYPYLLGNLTINRPDQVWGTDITYIKLTSGFCYLVAIMDWFSRYVVAWEVCHSLEIEFVLRNLTKALKTSKPEIYNSDQGSHFTSSQHTAILVENEIQISMDGRGRCMDNIFMERLWRTVKYENIYIKSYNDIAELRLGLEEYFHFYNNERFHSKLNDHAPAEVYFNKIIN